MTTTLRVRDARGTYRAIPVDTLMKAAREAALADPGWSGVCLSTPDTVKGQLKLLMHHLEQEVFAVLWTDTRHHLLMFEKLFYGTINAASVHTREVVKAALRHNAAACILVHNHPSGVSNPSVADLNITAQLKQALALVDVEVLDHMIVGNTVWSMAENHQI